MLKKAGGSRPFEYKSKSADQIRKRASQYGGTRMWYLKDEYPGFTPVAGSNTVRYMPSFEEDAEHWGLDVWVHFNVGTDKSAYICFDEIRKHVPLLAQLLPKGVKCPGCIERKRAQAEGELEYEEALAPKKRVITWVVNRDKEKEGPKLWSQPFSVDRDVCKICVDKKTQDVYELDNPYDGYDLTFDREGTDQKTKYTAYTIARHSTPLSDNDKLMTEWLQFVKDNPLSGCVVIPSVEEFEADLKGVRVKTEDAPVERGKKKAPEPEPEPEEEEEETPEETQQEEAEEEITWEFVQKAGRDFLEEKAEELGFDEESIKEADEADLREAICDSLKLEPPKKNSYKDKLRELRSKK
jgi:hypothetical protein